jgi:nifR3 family TIM-barrel protein
MKASENAEAILKAVRKSIDIPLTIKIRSGWHPSGRDALRIAAIAEECGVDAIAVHPRTATQGFRGWADWSVIAAVKNSVSIPVIGNGDIWSAQDAIRMQRETGCDAVMIGRAAIGNPWIFSQILSLAEGREAAAVDLSARFDVVRHYLNASVEYIGEKQACLMMRSRLGWFVKGLPHSSKFRESVKEIETKEEAERIIDAYQSLLQAHPSFVYPKTAWV